MAEKFEETAIIIRQEEIADDIYSMWLHTDQIAAHAKAGQFVSVYCNDGSRLLPRPISICEIDKKDGAIRLVYRVAGKGTAEFSGMHTGAQLHIVGPLGNGFPKKEKKAFLIGGGIGIPPMLQLAKELNCEKQIVLGFRALQGFVHSICTGQAFDIGIAHGGNVVAHGDACFLCRRAIVDTGHLGVTGLVDAKFHADAQNLAALDVHQFGVGVGSVVAGVLVARTQQITGGQAVVQGGLVDLVIIVAADVAVHLGDLIVHALLFLHAGNGAVEQAHRHQHRDGKGHRHGKDHDADRHANRDFAIHCVVSSSVRPAASRPRCPAERG